MKTRMRPVLALTVGTVLALVALEVSLQVLAALTGAEQRGASADGRPAILCVGDSNTYGIFLEAEDSYPGQLQAFLTAGGDDHVVVNRGYPGQNTAQVSVGLEEALRELAPSAVVVFAGVNDRWSDAGRPAWSGEQPSALSRLLAKSRVRRLIQLVRNAEDSAVATGLTAPDGRPTDAFFEHAGAVPNRSSEATRESIRKNLGRIAELSRARGARLVLVGYPLFSDSIRSDVNGAIRAAAEENGAAYVDLAARFEVLARTLGREHLYLPRDSHLSAIGNHEAARQVLLALDASGVVDVTAPPPLEEAYRGVSVAIEPDGEELVVRLEGPALWTWRLHAHGRFGEPEGKRGQPLEPKELGLDDAERAAWRGRFDRAGRATTRLRPPPPLQVAGWTGWSLSATATATAQAKNARDVRFSSAVALPE